MRADYDVLIDACVLANFGVCDLFVDCLPKVRSQIGFFSWLDSCSLRSVF
jgi:hypothetical protein